MALLYGKVMTCLSKTYYIVCKQLILQNTMYVLSQNVGINIFALANYQKSRRVVRDRETDMIRIRTVNLCRSSPLI